MMAQERHIVEEAYAGDIIGVFDPGIFLSEIQSANRTRSLNLTESRPSHRNILHVSDRWIR